MSRRRNEAIGIVAHFLNFGYPNIAGPVKVPIKSLLNELATLTFTIKHLAYVKKIPRGARKPLGMWDCCMPNCFRFSLFRS